MEAERPISALEIEPSATSSPIFRLIHQDRTIPSGGEGTEARQERNSPSKVTSESGLSVKNPDCSLTVPVNTPSLS